MANLIKSSSGLLFYDDFSEHTLMWTLSPSNVLCIEHGDKGLRMKHTSHYATYTIAEPKLDEYSCIVHLDHIPYDYTDIAGVIVFSSNKDYAECQTYLATEPSEITNDKSPEKDMTSLANSNVIFWTENDESLSNHIFDSNTDTGEPPVNKPGEPFIDIIYHYIKINHNKSKYIFYASPDSYNWIEVGNVKCANTGVIGFFIYGSDDKKLTKPYYEDIYDEHGIVTGKKLIDNSHCYFNDFAFYNSKYITINNIDLHLQFEIIDGNNKVIVRSDTDNDIHIVNRSSKEILINTNNLPMPIINSYIRIYPEDDYEHTIHRFPLSYKVYGGDSFTLERDIRLYINNTEINQLQIYDLGDFYRGSYYIRVDIHNHEEYTIHNVKIKVIKYSEYYNGEDEINIALYNESQQEDELLYKKEIIIDTISPSEGKIFFMQLSDKPIQDFYNTAHDFRFKILIE